MQGRATRYLRREAPASHRRFPRKDPGHAEERSTGLQTGAFLKKDSRPCAHPFPESSFLCHWHKKLQTFGVHKKERPRLVLVDTAKTWARVFGPAKGSVIREALVARLILERRLGQLLAGTVKHDGARGLNHRVIPDDSMLPEWIGRNVSSSARTLAKAPKRWFDKVID
jgi:hypothetical protein